jgi:hypothetical protein
VRAFDPGNVRIANREEQARSKDGHGSRREDSGPDHLKLLGARDGQDLETRAADFQEPPLQTSIFPGCLIEDWFLVGLRSSDARSNNP